MCNIMAEILNEHTTLNEGPWRLGTKLPLMHINMGFNMGGLGDYIHWTTALDWCFSQHPHLRSSVYVPEFFIELARHWLRKYEESGQITIQTREEFKKLPKEKQRGIFPTGTQLITAVGCHLLDLGFQYFANMDTVPSGWRILPEIRGDEVDISRFNLPKNYAVVTTEATAVTRMLPAQATNEITAHIKSKGILPVFLGKEKLTEDYTSKCSDGIDTEGVLDLREKTTIMEAACILANSRFVLGIDNGLIHLAACSEVPIIMGFTNVDPKHRIPPRRNSAKNILLVPPKELACRFCQSRMRFLIGHKFNECLYQDTTCIKLLPGKLFIKAIEELDVTLL